MGRRPKLSLCRRLFSNCLSVAPVQIFVQRVKEGGGREKEILARFPLRLAAFSA